MSTPSIAIEGSAQHMSLSLPRWLITLTGFSALTALFFWPWVSHLSSALIGPPEDNMQDFWNSWHAATSSGWNDFFFTRQIRWPEGTPLYYHSFAYPQVFVVAVLAKLLSADFATLMALQNITQLATFPLAAMTMFALARHLLGEVPGRDLGAAVAGFIFAFNPWHVAQVMHHAHVAGIEFLPLFVLFYLLALERRSWGWLVGATAMQALSALSCWYFFFYALYFMAFHLLYLRLRDKTWPRGWYLAMPAACAAGCTLLLSPWLLPMLSSGGKSDVYYVGNNMFVADLLAYVAFPPTHLLARFGSGVYAALTGNPWEGTVYLGLVNLAVLTWALTRKTDRRLLAYALGGMAFFMAIASGEALHVGGHVTPIHMPDIILGKLPFFANVRTPARAMVLVYLFLGLALAQATVLALRHRAKLPMVLTAVLMLMLIDFTPVSLAATPVSCPAPLQVIANDNTQFGVLDLPGGYENGNASMLLSACHGKPIVQGETSRKVGLSLADRLELRDLATQKRQLQGARVKYVVLHRNSQFQQTGDEMARYARTYRVLRQDRDMTVLKVY